MQQVLELQLAHCPHRQLRLDPTSEMVVHFSPNFSGYACTTFAIFLRSDLSFALVLEVLKG